MTKPPEPAGVPLADMTELLIRPMEPEDVSSLSAAIEHLGGARLKQRLKEQAQPMMNIPASQAWAGSPAQQAWRGLVAATNGIPRETYGGQLTEHLATLMCKSRWSNGSVATGVAKRAQGQQFQGNMLVIYDKLRGSECPAREGVPRGLMQTLSSAVDLLRGN
jgi:hypothetical protein